MAASSSQQRTGRKAVSSSPLKKKRTSPKFIDEDLIAFKNKVKEMKKVITSENASHEFKAKVISDLLKIVDDCKKHLGGDLVYCAGQDICHNFARYYTPRYNYIKRIFPEYVPS